MVCIIPTYLLPSPKKHSTYSGHALFAAYYVQSLKRIQAFPDSGQIQLPPQKNQELSKPFYQLLPSLDIILIQYQLGLTRYLLPYEVFKQNCLTFIPEGVLVLLSRTRLTLLMLDFFVGDQQVRGALLVWFLLFLALFACRYLLLKQLTFEEWCIFIICCYFLQAKQELIFCFRSSTVFSAEEDRCPGVLGSKRSLSSISLSSFAFLRGLV